MELCSYLRHPILDEPHLLEAKIETEPVEDLIGRQMFDQTFQSRNYRFDFSSLRFVDLNYVFWSVELREIQTGEKFKTNGTGRTANSQFKPFEESTASHV